MGIKNEKIKKGFIIAGISILVLLASFGGGYLLGCHKRVSNGTTELEQQIGQLEREYRDVVEQCEQLELKLGEVGNTVDGCISTVGQLRADISISSEQTTDALNYIKELRNRFTQCQNRIEELSEQLESMQASINK